MNETGIAAGQAGLNSIFRTAMKDPKWEKKYGPMYAAAGKKDQTYDFSKAMSAPDSWYGNTTAGYLLFSDAAPPPEEKKLPPEVKEETPASRS